ncbi:MAG TPA: pitrilysin family protein [Vicinamibacterales bacterium]|nr:pitrilysin family protein [Vicinamibacterales bacterium]
MPRFLAAAAIVLLSIPPAAPQALQKAPAAKSAAINIPFEHYTLPNGLQVILSQDKATPTVAVNLWYHVGSKNEEAGRTGFAHLFEHVMFTGSGNIPYGMHDKLTNGIGGSNNGTTDNDRTLYFETVPSNYLETALWLESDRMGFLLDALDIAKLNAQRDIVKNERRQRIDNQPYGRVGEILSAAMYPKGHPYSWSVIGSMEDLSAASEEDVKSFFRLYYAPNNAILTVVGDFEPAQTKQWITKYFGGIERGKPISRPKIEPVAMTAEKRLVFEDKVPLPRLYVQWPTVGASHPDVFALSVLGSVLSGGRTARLTKALVYDKQAAASISAFQSTSEDVGEFVLTVNPRSGSTLTALEQDADAIIEKLKAEGPTPQEIQLATASQELQFVSGLQSNLGKSNQLADGTGYHNDPGYYRKAYDARRAVTPDDVKRVANKYLTKGRVVLSVVPEGKTDLAARPEASQKVGGADKLGPGGTP